MSANRILDGQEITVGGLPLSLPSATDTVVARATVDTLTNKSIDGAANTITNVDLTSSVTNTLPVGNGGTGATTLGSGEVLLGNGAGPISSVAPGTNGNVLTSNGSTWQSSAPASTSPSLNGGSGSAQSVSAGVGVSLSSIGYSNFKWIVGNGGPVIVTATPSVTVGTSDGQILRIVGTDASNTVTLQDKTNLASSGLSLNGNWTAEKDSVLELLWDNTQSLWVEMNRR